MGSGVMFLNGDNMSEARTLDELPDQVFVPLGRRGMEGIPLKECAYECDGKEIRLLDVKSSPLEKDDDGLDQHIEDWYVTCEKCKRKFTIRCKTRFKDDERLDTYVSIIDDEGTNLGWLGSY